MFSPAPLPTPSAILAPLTDEEEAALSEAMEGYDDLEGLLGHLLDLGDKEWDARFRPTRRKAPLAGN